jgi:hypothetical protein
MHKVGQAVAAIAASAAVPALADQASAAQVRQYTAQGFVEMTPIDPVRQLGDYHRALLTHMCTMAELMREWYSANDDEMREVCPEYRGDLHNFMFETYASARTIAKAAGIEVNMAYVAECGAAYRAKAMGGAA